MYLIRAEAAVDMPESCTYHYKWWNKLHNNDLLGPDCRESSCCFIRFSGSSTHRVKLVYLTISNKLHSTVSKKN